MLVDEQFAEDYKQNKAIIDQFLPKDVIARLIGNHEEALKSEYNRLIKQEKKIPESLSCEQDVKKYQEITQRMNQILKELSNLGTKASDGQIENGF